MITNEELKEFLLDSADTTLNVVSELENKSLSAYYATRGLKIRIEIEDTSEKAPD
jgi:hypothetical protein